MKKSKIRISAVSFLNTLPFRFGMEFSPELKRIADISYDIPSVCAKKLENGEADIGLVPVEILHNFNGEIITDYCIGAEKKVDSVYLVGNTPYYKMDRILLDYRSRTSVNLAKVLAEYYWNINTEFVATDKNFESKIGKKYGWSNNRRQGIRDYR